MDLALPWRNVCRCNGEGGDTMKWHPGEQRGSLDVPEPFVSVTMIYNTAQKDSVCGLLHQHNLNSTVAAVKRTHPLGLLLKKEESWDRGPFPFVITCFVQSHNRGVLYENLLYSVLVFVVRLDTTETICEMLDFLHRRIWLFYSFGAIIHDIKLLLRCIIFGNHILSFKIQACLAFTLLWFVMFSKNDLAARCYCFCWMKMTFPKRNMRGATNEYGHFA